MGISVVAPVIHWGGGQGGGPSSPSGFNPNTGDPNPQVGYVLALPLPWLTPMPGAQQFNQEGDKTSVAPENNITITGISVDVPQGFRCRISSVSTYIDNMLTTTNVVWSVLVNSAPSGVAGFQILKMFPRLAPFVGNTFDSFLLIQGPATLTMVYSNIDGGNYIIGGALSGWIWNSALESQWKNNGGQWAG